MQNDSGQKPSNSPTSIRDQIRAGIFAAKRTSVVTTLYGQQVEIRQPTLGDIIATTGDNPRQATVDLLVKNTYVPGTQTQVFDASDLNVILNMPFDKEIRKVNMVLNDMMKITQEEAEQMEGNLEQTH